MNGNLSPDQFPAHGYVSINDHHEGLGLGRNYGEIGMGTHNMRKTGERTTLGPKDAVTPGQSTVYAAAVHKYVERPNAAPIALYKDPGTGETHVIDGHHRLIAARLAGRPVHGEYWENR